MCYNVIRHTYPTVVCLDLVRMTLIPESCLYSQSHWPWYFNFLVTDVLLYSLVTSYFLRSAPSSQHRDQSRSSRTCFPMTGLHSAGSNHPVACLLPLYRTWICVNNLTTCSDWVWIDTLDLALGGNLERWYSPHSSISSLPLRSVLYLPWESHICIFLLRIAILLPSSLVASQITILFEHHGSFWSVYPHFLWPGLFHQLNL